MRPPLLPPLLPTLFTALAVSAMLALGGWQLQRLHWKQELLASIAAAQAAPAIDLDALPGDAPGETPVPDLAWHAVKVSGQFDHAHELRLIPRTRDGQVGAELITPLVTANGRVWLINRGWVPQAQLEPATRPNSQPAGVVSVSGRARQPAPRSWMQPANNPARNQWFYVDLPAMAAATGQPHSVTTLYIEADANRDSSALPLGGAGQHDIPNNHLEYAITWFSLAGILTIIYAVFVLSRLRARR